MLANKNAVLLCSNFRLVTESTHRDNLASLQISQVADQCGERMIFTVSRATWKTSSLPPGFISDIVMAPYLDSALDSLERDTAQPNAARRADPARSVFGRSARTVARILPPDPACNLIEVRPGENHRTDGESATMHFIWTAESAHGEHRQAPRDPRTQPGPQLRSVKWASSRGAA